MVFVGRLQESQSPKKRVLSRVTKWSWSYFHTHSSQSPKKRVLSRVYIDGVNPLNSPSLNPLKSGSYPEFEMGKVNPDDEEVSIP